MKKTKFKFTSHNTDIDYVDHCLNRYGYIKMVAKFPSSTSPNKLIHFVNTKGEQIFSLAIDSLKVVRHVSGPFVIVGHRDERYTFKPIGELSPTLKRYLR